MNLFFKSLLCILLVSTSLAEDDVSIEVLLVDPRIVTHTKDTVAIGWENNVTDVIQRKQLTAEQSNELKELLKPELKNTPNQLFCGHSPAYVLNIKVGESTKTVSLCGLCHTWAHSGKLLQLRGKKSLTYLQELLPLPEGFAHVKDSGHLIKIDRKVPHHDLKKIAAEAKTK